MTKTFALLVLALLATTASSSLSGTYLVGLDLGVQYEGGVEVTCTDEENSEILALIETILEEQVESSELVIWSGSAAFADFTFDVAQFVEGGFEPARRRMSKKQRNLSGAVCQSRPDCASINSKCLWTCGSMESTGGDGSDVLTSWSYAAPAVNRALRAWIDESKSKCLGYKNKLTAELKVSVEVGEE